MNLPSEQSKSERVEPLQNADQDTVAIKQVFQLFQEWYSYLLSKWIVILAFALLGGIIGGIYSFFKKPVYSAVSTFVLEENNTSGGALGQYSGLASMVGLDKGDGGGIFQGDNLLELYKSRTMIAKTLLSEVDSAGKKILLVDLYVNEHRLRDKWKSKPELKNISFDSKNGQPFTRTQDSLIGVFTFDIKKNYLIVSKPDKKLNVMKVEINSTDEFFAKAFNDHIVANVNEFYLKTKTKKSLNNLNILQHQTDSIKGELNGALSGVASAIDANPNINPARMQLKVQSQRRTVDVEANKAILTQLITNMELAKVTHRKETPLIQLIDGPVFPLEKERLGKIKAFVIGAVVFGFLASLFLLFRYIIRHIMGSNS